jgi:hypothetical protein
VVWVAALGLTFLALPVVALAASPGDRLWLEAYSSAGSAADRGRAVAVHDGTAYVAATLGPAAGTGSDIGLIAYAPNGTRLWATRYDGPGHGADSASDVAVGPDGDIYVVGQATRRASRDAVLLTFAPGSGELLRQRFLGGRSGPDTAAAIAVTRGGSVVLTGSTALAHHGLDVLLAKYAADGSRLWVRTWDGTAHNTDAGKALAITDNGDIVVAGSTGLARASRTAGLLLKYSSSGHPLWVKRPGTSTGDDALTSVALDAAGSVYAGGHTRRPGTGVDALLLKCARGGQLRWRWVISARTAGRDEIAALCADGGGWVHAAGSTVVLGTHPDGLVATCTGSGATRRLRTYDGGRYLADAFETVVCDASGHVFVGGHVTASPGITSAVVAEYTRDLSQRVWLSRFSGTADGRGARAADLALTPGAVLATGTVVDAATGADVALAKLQH